jgi:hypothetical protein
MDFHLFYGLDHYLHTWQVWVEGVGSQSPEPKAPHLKNYNNVITEDFSGKSLGWIGAAEKWLRDVQSSTRATSARNRNTPPLLDPRHNFSSSDLSLAEEEISVDGAQLGT